MEDKPSLDSDIFFDDNDGDTSAFIHNTESELYNDLLLVEQQLKKLIDYTIISSYELKALSVMLGRNLSYNKAQVHSGIPRRTLSRIFSKICNIISLMLGGKFTNDGFIYYMIYTYNLDDKEITKLINTVYGYSIGDINV